MKATLHVWPNVAILGTDNPLSDSEVAMLRSRLRELRQGGLVVLPMDVDVVTHPDWFPLRDPDRVPQSDRDVAAREPA